MSAVVAWNAIKVVTLSKILVYAFAISVLTSGVVSFAVAKASERSRLQAPPSGLTTSRLKITDNQRRVPGSFGLSNDYLTGRVPVLILNDEDGMEVVRMTTDLRGRGELEFASDRWNEGAVIVGHLALAGEQYDANNLAQENRSRGWGISVRGQAFDFTRMGYLNPGELLVPEGKK